MSFSQKDSNVKASEHSAFAQYLQQFRQFAYTDLFGPKLIPMRYVINVFKGLTFIWVLSLMAYFSNYSTGMYLYLFLHGTYGIFWLVKDLYYPDASFKQIASIGSLVVLAVVLSLYWLIPATIAAGYGIQQPSGRRIAFCLVSYISGVVLMLGSDIQKTSTLAKRKGLISTGFFSRTRNPNYLGEIMIYGSFAACSGFWLSYAIVLSIWLSLFAINMYLKDEYSYKVKQGWEEYKQKSYILLPKLFRSDIINYAVYAGTGLILYNYYNQCCDGHSDHGHHEHHV